MSPRGVTLYQGRIELRVHYNDKDLAKSIGCRWDAAMRCWHVQATPVAAASVIDEFGDEYPIDDDVRAIAAPLLESRGSDLDRPVPITKTGREPWRPQREAFHFAFDRFSAASSGGVLLDMAMGTGKSRVVVDLIQNMAASNTLIAAPKSAVAVWPLQVLRWAHTLDDWSVTVLGDSPTGDEDEPLPEAWQFEHRSVAKRAEAGVKALATRARRHNVVVVNWEGFWRPPLSEFILDTRWGLVVGDEIHRIKSAKGQASKFASELEQASNTAAYRVGMSGTVMPHSPLDAFGVMRFVDRSLFGLGVTMFRRTYLFINPYVGNGHAITKNPATGDWFKDAAARREFQKRYGSVTYRAEKDLTTLPPLTSEYRWAELEPSARKHYEELMEEMYTLIRKSTKGMSASEAENAIATSPNAMVLTTRLQQILCGFLVDEQGVKHHVSDAKQQLLVDVLEDIDPGETVVVFARFVEDLDRIQQAAEQTGRKYAEVSGRRKDVKGVLRAGYGLVGVQVQSGSVGVDYTHACNVVFYSVWGGGDFAQARDRCHRPPQKRPVTQIALVTKPIRGKTAVDARLMKSLYANEDALRSIARDAVREAWRK